MPVHDKQMPETGLKWIKVAPGKWREDAEVGSKVGWGAVTLRWLPGLSRSSYRFR